MHVKRNHPELKLVEYLARCSAKDTADSDSSNAVDVCVVRTRAQARLENENARKRARLCSESGDESNNNADESSVSSKESDKQCEKDMTPKNNGDETLPDDGNTFLYHPECWQ